MARFYVNAEPKDHLFQWVEAKNAEEAMAKAMANPNDWTRSNLTGIEWNLRAQQHDIPNDLVIADAQPRHDGNKDIPEAKDTGTVEGSFGFRAFYRHSKASQPLSTAVGITHWWNALTSKERKAWIEVGKLFVEELQWRSAEPITVSLDNGPELGQVAHSAWRQAIYAKHDTAPIWEALEPHEQRVWEETAKAVVLRFSKEPFPAIELSDSTNMARSAYEAYMQYLTHPDPTGWDDGITDTAKRAWAIVVETIKELLKNNPDTAGLQLRFDIEKTGDFSIGLDHRAPVGTIITIMTADRGPTILRKTRHGFEKVASVASWSTEGDIVERPVKMTPEQAQQYADSLGLSIDQVWALFFYWQHGGP